MNVYSITGERTVVTEAIPSTPRFSSRKAAALFYGVSVMTISRWLANGRLDPDCLTARRLQAWEVGRATAGGYLVHTGPDWIEATELDQIKRLGLDSWLRLATATQDELDALADLA